MGESQEQPYPEHWLISGGPCDKPETSWRGGLCIPCHNHQREEESVKVFVRAEDENDLDWLLRFRAMIDKHDAIDCIYATSLLH